MAIENTYRIVRLIQCEWQSVNEGNLLRLPFNGLQNALDEKMIFFSSFPCRFFYCVCIHLSRLECLYHCLMIALCVLLYGFR